MKKTVLVTGSDGFIGSHLVEKLVKKDLKVKAFTYYNSFNSWGWLDNISKQILKEIEIIQGDIRDYDIVRKSVKNCDIIFHLAALIGIPYSYHAFESYIDVNIKGTLNVLRSAKDIGRAKVIHTSTSEVYGSSKILPITEKNLISAQSPYAASKIGADHLAMSFHKSFDLPLTILRPFNTFGPRQSLRAIIPTVITQMLSHSKKIKLGNIYSTRNFNYVSDIVDAFILASNKNNVFGETINIGNNFEISIKELVDEVAKILNKKAIILKDERRIRPKNSEIDRLFTIAKKASKLLKWKAKYSNKASFRKALKKTIEWYSSEKNLNSFKKNIYNY
jgi:dTDP-glucose 4,6-dehydratase